MTVQTNCCRLIISVMVFFLTAVTVQAQNADNVPFEKIVPANLTPEQRDSVNLEPEYSDAFYGQVDRLYLYGFWKFKPVLNLLKRDGKKIIAIDPKAVTPPTSDVGLEKGYFRADYDVSGWEDMPVPWTWNMPVDSGFRKTAFAGLGYYRTAFQIPAGKKGKRVILHFDSVNTECKVWLNGVFIGEHKNASYPRAMPNMIGRKMWMDQFELDITDVATYGHVNTLTLRVYDSGQPIEWNNIPNEGGIVGPVQVDFREIVDFDEMLIVASPDNGSVTIQAHAVNKGTEPITLALAAQVEPFKSKSYTPPALASGTTVELGKVTFRKGESRHSFSFKIKNPVLWDINCPALYRLRLVDGKRILGQSRFGFRKMEVAGKQFLLNGRPIFLQGLQAEPWGMYQQILVFNKADIIRQGCTLLKEAGFNSWRDNGGFQPQNLTKVVLDILDELGFVVQTDFSPQIGMLDSKDQRPEAMTAVKLKDILNTDNSISQYGRDILRRWLVHTYNHPAICLFTGGNEIGFPRGETEKTMADYLTAFYGFMKANDLQKRPVTSSAGLMIYGKWKTPVHADYYDYHCYAEEVMGHMDFTTTNQSAVFKRLAGVYGTIDKPVILGECCGYTSANNNLRPDLQALLKSENLDKSAYVNWANRNNNTPLKDYWDIIARQGYVTYAGIRSAVSHEALVESTAKLTGEFIRRLRSDTDFHAGFMTTRLDFTRWGLVPANAFLTSGGVLDMVANVRTNPEFVAQRQALAPLTAIPNLHDRHFFAGENAKIKIMLLNQQYATTETNLSVNLSIKDGNRKTISSVNESYAQVPEYARIERAVTLTIPADCPAGDYSLVASLRRGDAVVNEIATPISVFVRNKPAVEEVRKIAFYNRETQGEKSTQHLLEDMAIPHTMINDMHRIDDFDLLIIGANSLDSTFTHNFSVEKIQNWLKNGGRIVCFEQSKEGAVPFVEGMKYKSAGNMIFADVIDGAHPVLSGLNPGHWELWNGECVKTSNAVDAGPKSIYRTLLMPMPQSVVISGANRTWRDKDTLIFGMVAGEVKVGKGMIFFSQPLATARYGNDPVATVYLQNVLQYTLGKQWTGEFAKPVENDARSQEVKTGTKK